MNVTLTLIVVSLSILCNVFGSEVYKKIFTENLSKNEISKLLSGNDNGYRAPFLKAPKSVKNRYLVLFQNQKAMNQILTLTSKSRMDFDSIFKIHRKYDLIPGIAVTMSELTVDIFRRLKQIKLIESDSIMKIVQTTPDPNACQMEPNAEWCLSRSSNIDPNGNDIYNYPNNAGYNVTVYIIDTGVNISHPDIVGRAKNCANYVTGEPDGDNQGHGTACASLAAGTTAGIAKQANICAVKVLNKDGSGMTSDIINGVLWVARQPVKGIASMSLGGFYNFFLNLAVTIMINNGQFTAVAAGNEASDACMTSPASTSSAYTVAASNYTNTLAWFSNYGSCVDIIAPGTKCKLANFTTGGFSYASGTSMATPLIAGWGAIQKSLNNSLTPPQLTDLLNNLSLKNAITGDLHGTPNRFIHSTC